VDELIEKLRSVQWEVTDDNDWDSWCVYVDMRPDDFEALLTEAAAALEAAREDAYVALVVDIRVACGDNGKRSQPELVEYIRGLARDAERYRWLRDREIPEWLDLWHQNPDRIDAAIDAALRERLGEGA